MTNTYDTSAYPLGSTHPKVLFNNASNLDDYMHSILPSFPDRFGKRRETLEGLKKLVTDFLEAMGFEATHLTYVDGSPLTVLRPTQLVDRAGSVYKVKMPAVFPVELTGTWATDQLLLVDVGDASLRMALAATNGVDLVNGAISTRASVADIVAYTGTADTIRLTDPITFGDWALDPTDTTSAHDGVLVIVDALGRRRKRQYNGGRNAAWYGASPSVADNSAALQAAVAASSTVGGLVNINDAVYRFDTGLVVDYSSLTFPAVSIPSKRVDILGSSMGNTILEYNGTATALFMQGIDATLAQGINSADKVGNFTIYRNTRDQRGTGIKIRNKAHFRLENITSSYFLDSMVIEGALTGDLSNIILENSKAGLEISQSTYSLPNALNFSGVRFKANSFFGMKGTIGGGNVFTGGTCEGNGRQGIGSDGGMLLSLNGSNGSACLHLDSYYFENNAGAADLYLDNISTDHVTVTLTNCIFTRIDAAHYVNTNIQVLSSGGGGVTLVMNGCTFESKGSYVPDPGRPFFTIGLGCDVINNGCKFSETTSLGTNGASYPTHAGARTMGRVTGSTGASVMAPTGVDTARTGTGVYTITRASGWGKDASAYIAIAQVNSAAGAAAACSVVQTSSTIFTVNTYTAATGAAADIDFTWSCGALC